MNNSKRLWHYIFGKKEKLVITTEQIITCSYKSGEVIYQHSYRDLMGITKSLLVDSQNYILHFRGKPCFECASEMRNEFLDVIQQVYWLKINQKNPKAPRLKMYGVAAKSLGQFVTTEKDTLQNRNNLPTDYYLIGDEQPEIKGVKKNDDDEFDDYFDFVIIEKEEI